MEKQLKPVPDLECLKYHGTQENPDIKIFVPYSISDMDSEPIVDTFPYIPVRCGAVYDEHENVTMLGDDTGDNISERYKEYGDLTVQYWVWKNISADYYGFCKEGVFAPSDIKLVLSPALKDNKKNTKRSKKDDKAMSNWDIVTSKSLDISNSPYKRVIDNIMSDMYHFDTEVITLFLKIIQYNFPKYFQSANQYFLSSDLQSDSVWIAKKDVAIPFFEFQFAVLEALKENLDLSYAGEERKKVFSFLSNHIWGIYLNYLETKKVPIKRVSLTQYTEGNRPDILPAFDNHNIPVVFSSSNSFAPYLGITLKSMMRNITAEYNYDIIVLEKNISKEEKKRIEDICGDKENVSLRFINVKNFISKTKFYVPTKDLSEETYYTVLVPWVLNHYEKALVLDCDLIINADIATLYNTDLKDNYIGAVKELVYLGFLNNPSLNQNHELTEYTTLKLGLKNPYDYFNAGVLLMNLCKFRQEYSLDALLEMIDKNAYRIVEQDLFNTICAGKVVFLSYAWNFVSCLTDPTMLDENVSPNDTTIPNLKLAPEQEVTLYKEASKNPFIYHYLTKYKPWKYPFLKYADIWWLEARSSVYYETFIYQLAHSSAESAAEKFKKQILEPQPDTRTGARKLGDKLFPKGTRRREFAKKLLPKGSRRWRFCKQIYYIFRPSYRPAKPKNEAVVL